MVIEGVDGVALRRGPGHLPTTGLPGERRNCAIAAHRDGWFQRLPEVRVGDAVHVQTMEGAYEYVVGEKKVVTPDRSDLLNRGRKPYLTLITCTGPGYPRSAYRLLVFCKLRDPSSNDVTEGGAADRTETAVVPALLRTKLAQQQKTGPVAAGRPVAARPAAAGRAAVPSKAPKARVLVAAHRPAVSRRAKPVQPPSPRKPRARTIARAAAAAKRAEKRAAASVSKAPPPAPAAPPSPVVERQPDLDTPGTGEPAGDAPAAEEPADGGDSAQEETFPEADD